MKKVITKTSGDNELFDSEKLCASIINVGASEELARQICSMVAVSVESGMTTEQIFRITRNYINEVDAGLAAVYSLDRGLSALGPSGFIFEHYVSAMFREMGYETTTDFFAKGEAIEHEVDVRAAKGNVVFIIETKYRNDYKNKTHVNQVMYADARLWDIRRAAWKKGDTREYYLWMITNTQFTDNAINYVSKRDMQLMGWDFPRYINLKKIAYDKKLYPITVLPSVTKTVLKRCARDNTILVKDLFPLTVEDIQKKFSISERAAKKIEQEVLELMF